MTGASAALYEMSLSVTSWEGADAACPAGLRPVSSGAGAWEAPLFDEAAREVFFFDPAAALETVDAAEAARAGSVLSSSSVSGLSTSR